jgi:signal transduction histidine kinase
MHDEIGGTLGALKLMLVALRRQPCPAPVTQGITEIEEVLDGAMASADRIIRALRPAVLERGVVEALRHETGEFSRRHRIKAQFQSNRETVELPQGQALTVYRVCQEALSNVARHSAASDVSVDLFRDTGSVTLEIADNGRGFDTARLSETVRLGVAGMRERARSFGGWVQIDSQPGRGTTVMLQMPLRRVADITL